MAFVRTDRLTAAIERVKYLFIWLCIVHVLVSVWILYRGRDLITNHVDALIDYYRATGEGGEEMAKMLVEQRDLVVRLVLAACVAGVLMHALAAWAASREWLCSVLTYAVILTVGAVGSMGHFLNAVTVTSRDHHGFGTDMETDSGIGYTGLGRRLEVISNSGTEREEVVTTYLGGPSGGGGSPHVAMAARLSCLYLMAVIVNWAHMIVAFRLAYLIRTRDRISSPDMIKLTDPAGQA